MKACVASVLSVVMLLTSASWAMPIWQFDRMSDNDDARYIEYLVRSIKDASQGDPALRDQVERFFRKKQPGEAISGMGKFELNIAYARIADLEAVAKNPKVARLQVEDVLYLTMVRNGITLGKNFRPTVLNFRPQAPPEPPVTMEDAQKGLARTQAWVARTVGPNSPAVFSGFTSNEKALLFFGALIVGLSMANKSDSSSSSESSGSSWPATGGGESTSPSKPWSPPADTAPPPWKSATPMNGDTTKILHGEAAISGSNVNRR